MPKTTTTNTYTTLLYYIVHIKLLIKCYNNTQTGYITQFPPPPPPINGPQHDSDGPEYAEIVGKASLKLVPAQIELSFNNVFMNYYIIWIAVHKW